MSSNGKFLLQVVLLFVVTFGAGLWIFNDAPMPRASIKPMTPSAEIPTFEEHIAKQMDSDINGNEITVEYMQRRMLNGHGYSIISQSETYEKKECSSESRRYLIGRINDFDQYRRRYPGIELSESGEVTNDTVEIAINSLFLDGMLSINEFPAETRKWLSTFARAGSETKTQYIQECQAKG